MSFNIKLDWFKISILVLVFDWKGKKKSAYWVFNFTPIYFTVLSLNKQNQECESKCSLSLCTTCLKFVGFFFFFFSENNCILFSFYDNLIKLICDVRRIVIDLICLQPYQHGKIGMSIVTHWFVPKYQTSTNRKATYRVLDFFFGWWVHIATKINL